MKLEVIELRDFRQYRGTQSATFSMEKERNVTVFHGPNGAGKTGLFSAINWCLYGPAAASDIGELVNKAVLAAAVPGDVVTAAVTVTFRHEGERFIMRRSLEARKGADGASSTPAFPPAATMSRITAGGNQEPVLNVTDRMNSILSATVRPYFFFDGEKMDDLTRAGNNEVRDAVRNIMRLPALERAETHLGAIAADFKRDLKRQGSAELSALIAREEELRAEQTRRATRRQELQGEISLARGQIGEIEERLRLSAGAREMQKRRDSVQKTLAIFERQRDDGVRNIQKTLNGAYLRFLAAPAQKALALLDEKREKGEIPSGIREQVVKDLLEKHDCICGRPFCDGDPVFERLRGLLGRSTTSKMDQEAGSLAANIRQLSQEMDSQQTSLARYSRDRQTLLSDIEEQQDTLSEIKRQLEGVDDLEVTRLEGTRSSLQAKYEARLTEEGGLKASLDAMERELEVLKRQKADAEAKEMKLAGLARQEKIAQDAADAVARLKQAFFEETRRTVEASTKTVFEKLAWKQEHFQDVNIDEAFRLEVIDRWGMPTRRELSAGERQILSLAFICALSHESGEEAPLVMDTPFGRLSGNHLTEVARNLPDLTPQLVLFVTDREWDEASRTQLAPRAGRQYRLEFDRITSCTQIVEVK